MTPWTKVVTEPLGLAGFALFLVFAYLAKAKKDDERRWLSPVAIALAVIALLGGLSLAYFQPPKATPASSESKVADQTKPPEIKKAAQPPPQQQTNSNVQQTSTGAGSPNVQGVQGDVAISVDQSTGKTTTENKKPVKKPTPENP